MFVLRCSVALLALHTIGSDILLLIRSPGGHILPWSVVQCFPGVSSVGWPPPLIWGAHILVHIRVAPHFLGCRLRTCVGLACPRRIVVTCMLTFTFIHCMPLPSHAWSVACPRHAFVVHCMHKSSNWRTHRVVCPARSVSNAVYRMLHRESGQPVLAAVCAFSYTSHTNAMLRSQLYAHVKGKGELACQRYVT